MVTARTAVEIRRERVSAIVVARDLGGLMFASLLPVALFGFGAPELLLILVIVVVVFGASRLPQLGRGLGEGISNFRDGLRGKDDKKTIEEKKDPAPHA